MAPISSLQVGQTVGGKYKLLRESARSGDLGGVEGAAAVFEAEHAWTGKRFTLKVLAVRADPSLEMRFVREARAASALVHPNVVKVYDVDRDESGALYQVQELLEGETLEELLRVERRLSLEAVLERLLPVMDALTLAHDVGVVHRDVRPGTIFFSRRHDGVIVPKLIDFGVSKLLDSAGGGSLAHAMTVSNGALRNIAYLSPERLLSPEIDASVDTWAMAVVLYEALAGGTPFRSASQADLAVMIATRDAPHLWERARDLSPDVAEVIDRAILRKRDGRIVEMMVLVAELCAAAHHRLPENSENLIDAVARVHVDTDAVKTPVSVDPLPPAVLAAIAASAPVLTSTRLNESRAARLRLGVVGDPDAFIGTSTEDRLDRALMARTAVVRVPSYADLVDALLENRVDIAWLAPMAYARARAKGAVGLFEVARRGPRDPRALLIGSSPRVRSFDDLRGARAAWVDPWSTSGYVLQRRALLDHGIDSGVFSAEAFLGTHEAVGIAIASGRADVGGIVGLFDQDKNVVSGSWPEDAPVVVLAMSERLPSEVIAVSAALAPDTELIRSALRATGVPALAALIGADVTGELEPVDDARYAALLDPS